VVIVFTRVRLWVSSTHTPSRSPFVFYVRDVLGLVVIGGLVGFIMDEI